MSRYYRPAPICPECKHPTHEGRCTEMIDAAPLITARQPFDSPTGSGQRRQCQCQNEEES